MKGQILRWSGAKKNAVLQIKQRYSALQASALKENHFKTYIQASAKKNHNRAVLKASALIENHYKRLIIQASA